MKTRDASKSNATELPIAASLAEARDTTLTADSVERGAWRSVASGWKQLYGNFPQTGVSIETHSFHAQEEIDWGRSFHQGSLELCLNQCGTGEVRLRNRSISYRNLTLGFYGVGQEELQAVRAGGEPHTFMTVECSRDYLSRQVAGFEAVLLPPLRSWLEERGANAVVGETKTMTGPLQQLVEFLRHPPVSPAVRVLWYQSKINELLALTLFQMPPEENPRGQRVQLVARERAERVVELLETNLVDPPDLESMGRQIGCSPFYLSRTFSRVMGKTIPQKLRELRIQRAAELLRSGRYNVTEAAVEVGYTSLSHFSTAFCQITGCCPSLYPHSRHLINPGF